MSGGGTKRSASRDTGVLTPVDPPSRVGSAIITTNQAMEVDKAKLISVKTLAVSMGI